MTEKGGGNWKRDSSHRLARGTHCGLPVMEGSSCEKCRPAGGGPFQVNGCSASGRIEGRKRVQIEIKAGVKG